MLTNDPHDPLKSFDLLKMGPVEEENSSMLARNLCDASSQIPLEDESCLRPSSGKKFQSEKKRKCNSPVLEI